VTGVTAARSITILLTRIASTRGFTDHGELTNDQAHEMLKVKILGLQEHRIEGTNETIKIIPRSKTLNTAEFDEYVEKAIAWLREFPGIEVIACEEFYERPEMRGKHEVYRM
jgi:hypothetical protein